MKLSDTQVSEIRELWTWGSTTSDLGRMFGVTRDHVHGIVRGDTRKRQRLTPEEIKAKDKARFDAWRVANPDRWRAISQSASKRHSKLDRKRNPEKWAARDRQHTHSRRANRRGGVVTLSDWKARLDEFGHACAYCLRSGVRLTQDHVIALASGGDHHIDNIVPACKPCNCSKQARGPLATLNRKVA